MMSLVLEADEGDSDRYTEKWEEVSMDPNFVVKLKVR